MNLYLRLIAFFSRVLLRGRIGPWDTAVTPFRVWPTDLDGLGHMNNAKYLSLLDLARMDLLLRSPLWRRTNREGWYAVVAAQTIRYRRSLQPWQKFKVHTSIIGFDEKAIYFRSDFRVGDDVYASAVAQSRMLRRGGGHVTPKELVDVVGSAPEGELPEWVLSWAEAVRAGL